jgi:quinoprotein dehydrogenase-associated probable ABC transporter substrate-binding protein/PQQ-dependent catabolism-associated CXXCW motif protein
MTAGRSGASRQEGNMADSRSRQIRGWPACALALALLLLPPGARAATPSVGELVDHRSLRVCADPDNLPFSNKEGQGFENKIASLMAERLGVPLVYTWFPQTIGFVGHTLREMRCDLVIGMVSADDLVQTTNPYYHSTYVLVHRTADGDRYKSLDSPSMGLARIGVVAGTPPADLLVRKDLAQNIRPYHLVVDTRVEKMGRTMIEDLAAGRIDAALLWGPIAGYWVGQQQVAMTIVPLASDPRQGLRMDFRIAMGVRQGEPDWKHEINRLIGVLQPQLTQILESYHVPLLDAQGNLVKAEAASPAPAVQTAGEAMVPEPSGYRMDRYNAPVPATLAGATVIHTPALRRLLAEARPVLIDVKPRARKPADRDAQRLWIEPRRQDIAGSVWLPGVGYGELPDDLRAYLADNLRQLTGGDKARPLVFYCDAHCWMSWNAAKRAVHELGYSQVYWYPDGVEGWQAGGERLVAAEAVAMPASTD